MLVPLLPGFIPFSCKTRKSNPRTHAPDDDPSRMEWFRRTDVPPPPPPDDDEPDRAEDAGPPPPPVVSGSEATLVFAAGTHRASYGGYG